MCGLACPDGGMGSAEMACESSLAACAGAVSWRFVCMSVAVRDRHLSTHQEVSGMKRPNMLVCAMASLAAIVSGAAQVALAGPNDPDSTARTLVDQCANIKNGEIVLVS